MPTILAAAGLPQPVSVNGMARRPIEGVSMAYTWDTADAPDQRVTKYFEMFGSRAIYHDEWVAVAPPVVDPWALSLAPPPTDVMSGFRWQLCSIAEDWSQAKDLAAQMPDKLRDLQQLLTMQAKKYSVFPLDGRTTPARWSSPTTR